MRMTSARTAVISNPIKIGMDSRVCSYKHEPCTEERHRANDMRTRILYTTNREDGLKSDDDGNGSGSEGKCDWVMLRGNCTE